MEPQNPLDKLDSMVSAKLGRWPHRNPAARPLLTNSDALLEVLQWLPREALDRCREVCADWNEVIERNSTPDGQVLPQRRLLDYFSIAPLPENELYWPQPCLRFNPGHERFDMDSWMNKHPSIDLIKDRAQDIVGELVYPHEDHSECIEMRVRMSGQDFIFLGTNMLDEKDAYFFARLVFALSTASFELAEVDFVRTPELVNDETGIFPRSYLNPKVFTLPNLKPLKLVSRYFSTDRQTSTSAAANVVNTLQPMVKCEALWNWGWQWVFDYADFADTDYLELLASARPLKAPGIIYARLDREMLERLIKFFESSVLSFASMVSSVYVRFAEPLPPWPAGVLWDAGADSRQVDMWGRAFEYRLSNRNSGEEFKICLHGARNPADDSDNALYVQRMDVVIRG